ncbi:MAG: SH3 domain-containing protein [Anaerolineae bacterium]|jgi:hypothetical protein|nr:SH3 domain-containing protein [Anaerolineae bacterium]
MRPQHWFLILAIVFGVAPSPIFSQLLSCPSIVEQALLALGDNCSDMSRNSACYGYNAVFATFKTEVEAEYFTTPSDRADLALLQSLQTSAYDAETQHWGVALLNVQANIPNTLPGQNVVYILMGDAQINDRVGQAPDLTQMIDLTVSSEAEVRSQPSLQSNLLGTFSPQTVIQSDLRSEDGQWFRTLYNGLPGWVNRAGLMVSPEAEGLPNPSTTSLSPMQAFQFTTGIGNMECQEAQGSLLIQGPEGLVVDLEANGAKIRLASTILLTQTEDRLQVTTLSGAAQVENVIVPAGFTTEAEIGEDQQITTAFTEPVEVTLEEIEFLDPIEDVEILNYEIDSEDLSIEWETNDENSEFTDEFESDFEDFPLPVDEDEDSNEIEDETTPNPDVSTDATETQNNEDDPHATPTPQANNDDNDDNDDDGDGGDENTGRGGRDDDNDDDNNSEDQSYDDETPTPDCLDTDTCEDRPEATRNLP